MRNFSLILGLALAATIGSADAANLTKQVELNNGNNGLFKSTTRGDVSRANSTIATSGRFQRFVLGENGPTIDGSLDAEVARSGETRQTSFDGNFTIDVPASADGSRASRTVSVQFTDLTIVREDGDRHFNGNITVNGQSVPADELPARFQRMLGGLLRMLRM